MYLNYLEQQLFHQQYDVFNLKKLAFKAIAEQKHLDIYHQKAKY